MHKLRLIKGLSYNGVVQAAREQPEVLICEEEIYQSVMASGYFEEILILQEDGQKGERDSLHQSLGEAGNEGYERAEQEESTTQEDMSRIEKISIDSMDVEELRAYAALNGIDLSGRKKKADMIAAIKAGEKKAAEARNALRLE